MMARSAEEIDAAAAEIYPYLEDHPLPWDVADKSRAIQIAMAALNAADAAKRTEITYPRSGLRLLTEEDLR